MKYGSELSHFIWELEQIIAYIHTARNNSQMLSHLIPANNPAIRYSHPLSQVRKLRLRAVGDNLPTIRQVPRDGLELISL